MKKFFFLIISLLTAKMIHAQNVGIGTTTPNAKLDVIGTIKVTDGTQGEGKILTSDAAGLASWQEPPPLPVDYPVVRICCSSWMSKNLDVSTYRNGDPIPHVTNSVTWAALTTGAYCYYNNDSTNYAATYGKLYNWYAINDPRGLAPDGWHTPSDLEWSTLGACLGGNAVAGGLLKEMGTSHWSAPNDGATNQSNFTALPGGLRYYDGSFDDLGDYGFWWTSSQSDTDSAWNRTARYSDSFLTSPSNIKQSGYSVRCVKDE